MPRFYSEEPERFVIKSRYGDKRYLELPMHLTTITGIGIPPISHRTVRSPFQHGESHLGFSLRPRPVQVALHLRECNRLELWYLRRTIINLINPLVGNVRLRAEFRDGSIFELHNVAYDAGFDMGTDGMTGPYTQNVGMRFMAYDPVWWEYPQRSESPSLTIVNDLVFGDVAPPSTAIFPITFGAVHIDEDVAATVGGNWMAFPVIELTGPMEHPIIENLTTDEKLELNYNLVGGEVVTITTQFGNKTVVSSNGDDLIGYLTTDSDLATFHLDPDPIATDGLNTVSFYAVNCTINSVITMRWFDRHLGL